MTTIGQRIRAARKMKGWTIRKLAIKADYTEVTISNVELGKYLPSERLLRAIEKALNEKLRK